jgi:dUTP pyrophosphatase
MSVLSRQQIMTLLQGSEPLLSGYSDIERQLQPNGFDLTLGGIARFETDGHMGSGDDDRRLAATAELAFNAQRLVYLPPGPYLASFNETVRLPSTLMALARPRSSLLRSGVAIHNAVWDAGYHGRSQALLVVYNTHGYSLALGARLLQLVFMELGAPTDAPYAGRFQGERL